jgi:hypothetical protein
VQGGQLIAVVFNHGCHQVIATAHAVVQKDVDSPIEDAENRAILRAIGGFPEPQPPPAAAPPTNGHVQTAVKQLADEHGMKTGDQIEPPHPEPKEPDIDVETVNRCREFSEKLSAAWTRETLIAVSAEIKVAGEAFLKAMDEQGKTAKHRVLLAEKPSGEWSDEDVDTLLLAVEKAPTLDDFHRWANSRLPQMTDPLRNKFCKADEWWRKKHK